MGGGVAGERVWVTGVGLVTALGNDVARTWGRLLAGERSLAPLTLFDTAGQRASVVAEVAASSELSPPDDVGTKWSRTSRFAWKAAKEALDGAGLAAGASRVGLVVGGTTGGMFETESLLADLHVDPSRDDSLVEMISQPLTATGDRLGETLGPFARVRSLCSACSSGANAFAVGATWLLSGDLDVVLVGGSDGLCRLTLSGFNALAATDPEMCRPFDARRRGLNLGEGAGFAVLERASSVLRRGKEPVAELAGWALGAEAHHITNPEPTGAAASRIVSRCLRRAGLSPCEVDYVNAHGTATPLNDSMESAALRLALGEEVLRVPVSSSKGQIGHTLGAAGAVEAVFSALAIRDQRIPPTVGLEQPDEACALVHVTGRGRPARVRAALSNSFGFGGMDAVLVLTEPELGPAHTRGARRVVITGAAALTPHGLEGVTGAGALIDGSLGARGAAPAGPLPLDLGCHLDAGRGRRLDRPARLGAVVVGEALAQAKGERPLAREDVGLIVGTAFGSLDPSAAFMHRLFEKGPRLASPAEFPNLVPSSPVGHVSIYHGLSGPSVATADLGTSGESAVAQAVELIAAGDADAIVTGGVEEASDLVERIRTCLHAWGGGTGEPRRPRSEGAGAVVVEAEEHARARGCAPLAVVRGVVSWADAPPPSIPPPEDAGRARVVVVHEGSAASRVLDASGWAGVTRTTVSPVAGDHEGLGAVALVAATSLVHRGIADEILVVGTSRGRGYAITLARPGTR